MGTHFATRVPAQQYPAGTRVPVYQGQHVLSALNYPDTRIPVYPFTALVSRNVNQHFMLWLSNLYMCKCNLRWAMSHFWHSYNTITYLRSLTPFSAWSATQSIVLAHMLTERTLKDTRPRQRDAITLYSWFPTDRFYWSQALPLTLQCNKLSFILPTELLSLQQVMPFWQFVSFNLNICFKMWCIESQSSIALMLVLCHYLNI